MRSKLDVNVFGLLVGPTEITLFSCILITLIMIIFIFVKSKSTFTEIWERRMTYLPAFTHTFDMGSDLALMIEFFQLGTNKDLNTNTNTNYWNPLSLAISMLLINIMYRFVSSIQIYLSTKKLTRSKNDAIKAAILQFLDVLLIQQVYIAFSQKRTQPTVMFIY